ncbi:hypothetical protein SPI_05353 [Niveomyces insectorum RCEF 264]|uniref:Uncharacterized protein n=1 Tax=Niveomyces insectorum RCEF 264 TaxID=1081102 RepID=A0A167T4P7_9HYPO|nr:hypothetical protein SPI_05353 [Niveomyces insectorum RCEF 264]
MPFFSRHSEPEEEAIPTQQQAPVREPEAKNHHGLFGSLKRNTTPPPPVMNGGGVRQAVPSSNNGAAPTLTPENNEGGLFRRSGDANSIASSTTNNNSINNGANGANGVSNTRGRSFLQRSFGNGNPSGGSDGQQLDPSIVQARERVLSAELAEREADRALDNARCEVRAARDHVRRLELEAKEEARRAQIKQFHVREVSRRAKPLGRHDL